MRHGYAIQIKFHCMFLRNFKKWKSYLCKLNLWSVQLAHIYFYRAWWWRILANRQPRKRELSRPYWLNKYPPWWRLILAGGETFAQLERMLINPHPASLTDRILQTIIPSIVKLPAPLVPSWDPRVHSSPTNEQLETKGGTTNCLASCPNQHSTQLE